MWKPKLKLSREDIDNAQCFGMGKEVNEEVMIDEDFETRRFPTETATIKYRAASEKMIVNGMVPILLSTGYSPHGYRTHTGLIGMILYEKPKAEIVEYAKRIGIWEAKYPNWLNSLFIEWVKPGSFYLITKCADDGESLIVVQDEIWNKV